jgi:uracil-DNA glycosylase
MSQKGQPETTAAAFLPDPITLTSLRRAVQQCRGCSLYEGATQAVFGEGLRRARLMLVGEQPGDVEDRQGRPFVGPAGLLLDKVLAAAGVERTDVFVTNAVKHFKSELRGKRRIHKKPTHYEIKACRPWLDAELRLVAPDVLVLLGASAARALLGTTFRVTEHRGQPVKSELAPLTFATLHPAALLRIPDDAERRAAVRDYVDEFRFIAAHL